MKGNVSHKAEIGQRAILLFLWFYIIIIKAHEGKGGKRRMMEAAGETHTDNFGLFPVRANIEVDLEV